MVNWNKFTLALILTSLGTVSLGKDWTKIRVGVEGAYPPFSEMGPDGKLKGFDIDMAYALCEELKAKCTLVAQDWDGIIPALLARKYDMIIASMSITEERKKKVAFTNKYYQTPARCVAKVGHKFDPKNKATLKGKTVGVQRGTVHAQFIKGEFQDSMTVKTYATQDEAYLDLAAGRLDMIVADSIAASNGFLKTPKGKGFAFFGPEYTDKKYFGEGSGIALRKRDKALKEKLNKAILTLRANGTYDKIQKKYFKFDIYGSSH